MKVPQMPRMCRCMGLSVEEDEVGGAEDAKPGPEVVELEGLAHVEHGERHEHRKRHDLLRDLELRECQPAVEADAVSGDLQQVLEERDAPARDGGDPPRLIVEIPEV